MGQQQLLLVILVTILVGIATVVAINVFGDAAARANVDAVRQDLLQGASGAQAVWTKPRALGGAGGDFTRFAANPEDLEQGLDDTEAFLLAMGMPVRCAGTTIDGEEITECSNENGLYRAEIVGENEVTLIGIPRTSDTDTPISLQVRRLAGNWETNWLAGG